MVTVTELIAPEIPTFVEIGIQPYWAFAYSLLLAILIGVIALKSIQVSTEAVSESHSLDAMTRLKRFATVAIGAIILNVVLVQVINYMLTLGG